MTLSTVNRKKTKEFIIVIERRPAEASQKVNAEIKKSHEMINNIKKKEDKYINGFQFLKKPCLGLAGYVRNTTADITEDEDSLVKDISAISSESRLSPLELFLTRNGSNSSLNASSFQNHMHFIECMEDYGEYKGTNEKERIILKR
jgi:hypothetical protein